MSVAEWLIEIPVNVSWANLAELRRLIYQVFGTGTNGFFPQVQRWYVRHNTSSTIELRQEEVEALGNRIYNLTER